MRYSFLFLFYFFSCLFLLGFICETFTIFTDGLLLNKNDYIKKNMYNTQWVKLHNILILLHIWCQWPHYLWYFFSIVLMSATDLPTYLFRVYLITNSDFFYARRIFVPYNFRKWYMQMLWYPCVKVLKKGSRKS